MRKKPPPIHSACVFCKQKLDPDYKNIEAIERYVTDRGRIMGTARSGTCSKHQRKLATAVKRARHLGLLSYTGKI